MKHFRFILNHIPLILNFFRIELVKFNHPKNDIVIICHICFAQLKILQPRSAICQLIKTAGSYLYFQ